MKRRKSPPGSTPTAESLLEGAEGFLNAFTIVSKKYDEATDPMGLLAAHCLEIALKSYLLRVGRSEKDLKNVGHDLLALWRSVPPDLGLVGEQLVENLQAGFNTCFNCPAS
jgi:hypothetical protein